MQALVNRGGATPGNHGQVVRPRFAVWTPSALIAEWACETMRHVFAGGETDYKPHMVYTPLRAFTTVLALLYWCDVDPTAAGTATDAATGADAQADAYANTDADGDGDAYMASLLILLDFANLLLALALKMMMSTILMKMMPNNTCLTIGAELLLNGANLLLNMLMFPAMIAELVYAAWVVFPLAIHSIWTICRARLAALVDARCVATRTILPHFVMFRDTTAVVVVLAPDNRSMVTASATLRTDSCSGDAAPARSWDVALIDYLDANRLMTPAMRHDIAAYPLGTRGQLPRWDFDTRIASVRAIWRSAAAVPPTRAIAAAVARNPTTAMHHIMFANNDVRRHDPIEMIRLSTAEHMAFLHAKEHKRRRAARRIWNAWQRCVSDPQFAVCRRRLQREWRELPRTN